MSKYLILYKVSAANQPTDPKVAFKEAEVNLGAVEELQKAGIGN